MLKKGNNILMPVTINKEWSAPDIVNQTVMYLGTMDELTEADARAKMLIYLLENKLIDYAQHPQTPILPEM